MGELAIRSAASEDERREFTRAVVSDIRALETLIDEGRIETGITRMGAEQEMYLVGDDGRPAPVAVEVLKRIDKPHFTTELARFNIEANFPPRTFGGDFLERLEADLGDAVRMASAAARIDDAEVLLTGILPTLRDEDLTAENLTPEERYVVLNEAMLRGRDEISVSIDGIDSYEGTHDSVLLESANTSLQLHLQVDPAEGAALYNLMQLVTAPLLAAAVNSPVLLGRRLWHETRIAVFERSLDQRSGSQLARGAPTRVLFGDGWLTTSLVEIFHDNLARFPVLLTRDLEEDALDAVAAGRTPTLAALALHNGTVWRWNRPCFGVADGVLHLRIENRALPAGPTVVDEVANAALFYGMMAGLPGRFGNVADRLPFDFAESNFVAAARLGLDAEFDWLDERRVAARELLIDELIPAARDGLRRVEVPDSQIDRYLGIAEQRVASGRTGAAWLLDSFQAHRDRERDEVWRAAVFAMREGQRSERPVHEWDLAAMPEAPAETEPTVGDIMTADLFTVRPDDVVDLAMSVMEWKHIRHIPVEGETGELFGVLTARDLLRAASDKHEPGTETVRAYMRTDFLQTSPETTLRRALARMLTTDLGCLLIVTNGKLAGIVTERDLMRAAGELLDREADEPGEA